MKKKILSVCLLLIMVFSLFPAEAFAATQGSNLGWKYAIITKNSNGTWDAAEATGTNDLAEYVTVTSTMTGDSAWQEGKVNSGLIKNAENSDTVTVTCDEGYYIAYIALCCDDHGGYDCRTFERGNSLANTYGRTMRSATIGLDTIKRYATHTSNKATYWLMIMIKKNPDPVYVGYELGEGPVFTENTAVVAKNGEGWLENYYTQKYENVKAPNHTVLDVSADAKAQALAQGYVFVGWSLKYYHDYAEANNAFTNPSDAPAADKAVGDTVSLYTYAKLTAKWEEIPTQDITITKSWDDADNQDNIRPKEITVNVKADGAPYETVTLKASENWTKVLTVPTGKTYTVEENPVAGYTPHYKGLAITNVHTPEKIAEMTVTKEWDDENNKYGLRPDSIEVQLYADGQEVGEAVEVTAEDNWTYTWKYLDKFAAGEEIEYTVEEVEVPEYYTSEVEGFTITNTLERYDLYVEKYDVQGDFNDEDYVYLNGAEFTLYADKDCTEVVATGITADDANGLAGEIIFEDLVKGKTYYLLETKAPAGYLAYGEPIEITYEEYEGWIFVPNMKAVEVMATKVWDDNNDQDGIRPDSVEVQLYADGKEVGNPVTLNAENKWTYTWTELQEAYLTEDGYDIIEYTVKETAVPGYETVYGENGIITNVHAPETTSKTVTKVWKDNNSESRPDSIEVQLYADGKAVGEAVKVTAKDNWTYTWENLPKYADGKEIKYTVEEKKVDGYEASYSEDTFTITNTIKETPNTGDNSNIWLYAALMGVSALAIAVLFVTKKKRKAE